MSKKPVYKDVTEEQKETNEYARLVPGQTIIEIPSYTLECGETLENFPLAYKTWGRLNEDRDNVLLIAHALTGSSDVQDWWGPLLGTGKAFDPSRFFIVCINLLGSPYGSCSPVTIDKATGKPYGPSFPLVTIKDDLGIQKLLLDHLRVKSLACVIGGSMGGMLAMEYSATYNKSGYVRSIIAIATSARASAWCISWNETQRQSIFSDPNYDDGYYYENTKNVKPDSGLSAARMTALLTYRSRNSFETRFGRQKPKHGTKSVLQEKEDEKIYPKNKEEENWLLHNEGSRTSVLRNTSVETNKGAKPQTYFTAQSYLRYQGTKFVNRFDANCYISLTRKLDTHDITRNSVDIESIDEDPLPKFLETLTLPHLVVGIMSDGLFTYGEQQLLNEHLQNSKLIRLDSPEGHDAFLLEFKIINQNCIDFMRLTLSDLFDLSSGKVVLFEDWQKYVQSVDNGGNSVFGEAEKNITNW